MSSRGPVGFFVIRNREVPVYAILLPLLPLLTTLMVAVGDERSRRARAQLAAFPIGAAFCGAVASSARCRAPPTSGSSPG